MANGNFWDIEIWSLILIFGVIGASVLFSSILKSKVAFLKRSLVPSSVLAGIILLVISTIVFYATGGANNGGKYLFELEFFYTGQYSGMTVLEIITYHCLGFGFVAMAFRQNGQKVTGKRAQEVLDSGVTTVSTYLLQAILGIIATIVFALLGSTIWKGAGILLPFGFGQGTGQALNYGSMYGSGEQAWGFISIDEGRSFGLTIAALGFLAACIGGVIYLNVCRKKGLITIQDGEETEKYTFEQIVGVNEIPMSGSVDKMSIQLSFVIGTYGVSYALMSGLSYLLPGMRATIFGFNFLLGTLLAVLLKAIIGGMNKKRLFKRRFINNFLMNRIGGFFFDFMIVAGIAAIRIDAIRNYWGVLLALGLIGMLATFFYVNFICKKLFPDYRHQQFLAWYGMLTGTASTGIILLREIDSDFLSPAADNLVYQNLPAIVLGLPIMLFASYIYNGGPNAVYITLGIATALFVLLQVVLFRRSIFKKKKTEQPAEQ